MKEFIKKLITSIVIVLFMAAFRMLYPSPTPYHYISLLFLILIVYYLIWARIIKLWESIQNKSKKSFPKIGILNGNIISPMREHKCQKAWTNITASMWNSALHQALLDKTFKKIELIPTSEINNSFSIIVNPFGDVFPEKDIRLHTTFYEICEYIKKGGIFVCTGGSFFSHQNTIHSTECEWVFKKTTDGMQSLKDSFLYSEFGVETTGDIINNMQEPIEVEIYQKEEDKVFTGDILEANKIKRFRALQSKSSDYIPFIREKNDDSFPIAAVRYGKGYLLHAGIFLESEASEEFKLLIRVITNLIKSKFKSL